LRMSFKLVINKCIKSLKVINKNNNTLFIR
jgi:hypothetical protein